jgi:hypothetical protein
MNNPNLHQIAKELDRKAGRLENEAAGLRQQAEALRAAHAVTEPLLRAVAAIANDAKK